MTTTQMFSVLERLAKTAHCPTLRIHHHEHAVAKLNALISALEIARIIPKARVA